MQFTDESFIYRIMGIDNGSSNLGIAVLELDLRHGEYTVLYTRTLIAEKLLRERRICTASHGSRWERQNILKEELSKELWFHNPHNVAVETPFFMPRRVQSFETLTEMMIFIRQAVYDFSGNDIYGVSPGEAKRAVQTEKFTMKKDAIKDCVLNLNNLIWKEGIHKGNLTEHEYDAIAVARAHGEAIRKATGFLR